MPNKTPWGPEHPDYDKGCPVAPGTDCTVWFRDGSEARDRTPEDWGSCWQHDDHPSDITFFTDHSAPDQARELPADILRFLMGTGPLEGVHFGDGHPTRKGAFWWRTVIRERVPNIAAMMEDD